MKNKTKMAHSRNNSNIQSKNRICLKKKFVVKARVLHKDK